MKRTLLALFLLLNLFAFSSPRKLKPLHEDQTVLLELKSAFSDPHGVLSSWDPHISNHCSWFGVSCNSDFRVVSLILRGHDEARLGGEISPVVGSLSEIRVLSLAFNNLGGQVPEEIWKLERLVLLDLQGNNFIIKESPVIRVSSLAFDNHGGQVPEEILRLERLELLDLQGNNFIKESPGIRVLNRISENLNPKSFNNLGVQVLKEIWRLKKLEMLDLQGNNFIIKESPGIRVLNRISEDLNPKLRKLMSLTGEEEEEVNEVSRPSSDKTGLYPIEIASIVSASVIVSVLLVLVVLFIFTRKWKRNSQVQVVEPKEIKVFADNSIPLTYEIIVRATGYFSNSNCIGHGGFGSTYKAEVSPNNVFAVKRLSVGRFQGDQQFHAEILALELVKHPNLVMLVGYHASETEMFLIYNYLSGGNLEDFIKERSKAALDWNILHKIALDVARALAYLHDQCSPKVLHRDIKPSNILLDNNYNAYLSDFGLSKLLGNSQSHVTTGVAGTFGYVAPEYAMTCRVSEKADVYSYGIVILELISDKRALDPSFSSHENGFNIVSWAHMMLSQGKAKEVFTKGLWETGPQDDLVEVLHLALKCTVDSLSIRPTMKQAVKQLKRIHPSRL